MSVGIYTGVKYMVLEHDFRNISVRIVFRDVNLKPENNVTRNSRNCLQVSLPEHSLLVWALPDEQDSEPEEGGVS